MKLCLVGHFNSNLDEGVRIVGKSISKELEKYDIKIKNVDISSILNWRDIIYFNPDIIHFLLTPTIKGLLIAKFISTFAPKAKIIVSALHPSVPQCKILKFLKPDLILVQSMKSNILFRSIGFTTKFVYNGVDIEKFKPVDGHKRAELRKKYKISDDKFILLHLASLKRERNLDILKKIQTESNQVLIIGRENESIDDELVAELEECGCLVWIKHFQNIEEIYNLSDCYIFPTIDSKACIETPLSILEAMACNLPVITTKFGAIPDLFNESNGFFYINQENDIIKLIEDIKNNKIQIDNRKKVYPYSWDNIIIKMVNIYGKLLQ